ncbi:MAG: amidohydrolase family protein [Firmicutes bacterium]|nr:amidohydrolase family protein [Bacillota bacterium]
MAKKQKVCYSKENTPVEGFAGLQPVTVAQARSPSGKWEQGGKTMRIVDIHTHIYPDQVAQKAIAALTKGPLRPLTGCTAAEAQQAAEASGVIYSVCLPVATRAKQVEHINRFSAETNSRYSKLICFAGIFPGAADMEAQIDLAAQLKLPGIKIHPQFQGVFLDDPAMVRLVCLADAYHMPVIFHGGLDIAKPYPLYSSPWRAAHLLQMAAKQGVSKPRLIFAHMGGYALWGEVEKELVGKDVYFDTSFLAGRIPKDVIKRIILNHGAERILFGTDFPWQGVEENRDFLLSLGLSQQQNQAIFYDNAAALLHLDE